MRVERSETVRVERVHTSQFPAIPGPDELSTRDAARQMLKEHGTQNSNNGRPSVVINGASHTSLPGRPPPRSSVGNSELSTTTTHGEPGASSSDPIDVDPIDIDVDVTGQRASERIEIPDRVYSRPVGDHQQSKSEDRPPASVEDVSVKSAEESVKSEDGPPATAEDASAEEERKPAFFQRFKPTTPPKPRFARKRSASPKQVRKYPGSTSPFSDLDGVDEQKGDTRPGSSPGSTNPAAPKEVASFKQQERPHGSVDAHGATWSRRYDPGETERPGPEQVGSQQSSSERPIPPSLDPGDLVDGPAFRPVAPEIRQHTVDDVPVHAYPDSATPPTYDPTISQSQRTFRPPPVLNVPVEIERPPSLELPALTPQTAPPARAEEPVEEPVEIDPFDEYLEDPLGFFAPSIEMDVIPERGQSNTRSTRMLRSAGEQRVNPSFAGDQGAPDYFDDEQESNAGRRSNARRKKSQNSDGRAKASNPSSGRRQRAMSSEPEDAQLDYYDDDYDEEQDPKRRGVRSILDRLKHGSVFVILAGLVIMGLSARFAFSGADAPEGEILQHQAVSWWSDTDSASRSFIPDDCVANLEALGASKRTVEWSALEVIPRQDRTCEKIITPES